METPLKNNSRERKRFFEVPLSLPHSWFAYLRNGPKPSGKYFLKKFVKDFPCCGRVMDKHGYGNAK
jgi:hypothetical protein